MTSYFQSQGSFKRVPGIFLFLVLSLVCSDAFSLIGGKLANQWKVQDVLDTKGQPSLPLGIFPSVVLLPMGCTGAVVGPRHILTAAHCVVEDRKDRTLLAEFSPGKKLLFDTRAQWALEDPFDKSYSHSAGIVRTFVHSSYVYAGLNENFPESTGDIAIFVLDRDIGSHEVTKESLEKGLLPIASVGFDPLTPDLHDEKIVKLGYGCESVRTDAVYTSSNWRLKYDDTQALPDQVEALRRAATYEKIQFKDVFDDFYWISKGYFFDEKNEGTATICPGDSGGPLYSIQPSGLKIVGVNSRSRLGKGKDGIASVAIDFHTRVDKETPLRVDRWIERAVKYPKEKWYQGIAYSSVVPRATDFTNEIELKVRKDLYVPSRAWLAFLDGINGTCPLKFGRVSAKDASGKEVVLKPIREATQTVRLELDEALTAASIKAELLPDKNVREDDHAGICYVSVLALE